MIFFHGFMLSGFGLLTGSNHKRFGVIKGNLIEYDVRYNRVVGADKGLTTTGAFLIMLPNNGNPWCGFKGFGNLTYGGIF